LQAEVQYYQYALDLVTDQFDFECEDDMREQIEKSARHLYGLVHARYIITTRGLAKMVVKHPSIKLCAFLNDDHSWKNTRNAISAVAPEFSAVHTHYCH